MLIHGSRLDPPNNPPRSVPALASLAVVVATLIAVGWIGLGMLLVGSS